MLDHQESVHLALAPTTAAPKVARDAVQGLLNQHTADFTAEALLLTSELVTNAVVHTGAQCTLYAQFDPALGSLRVEVADVSTHVPAIPVEVAPGVVGGHGLRLVAAMARRWGIASSRTGKTMWFELGGH